MRRIIRAFSPSKIILFGEHAVVYGYPAIAMALNLGTRVTLKESPERSMKILSENYNIEWNVFNEEPPPIFKPFKRIIDVIAKKFPKKVNALKGIEIHISTQAPAASGLGTSASTAVAFTAAVLKYLGISLSANLINEIAYEAEKVSHGRPSGIDNYIATYGGVIKFTRNEEGPRIERLNVENELPLLLVYTGVERKTKEAVEYVAELRKKLPSFIDGIFDIIGEISERVWNMFKNRNMDLEMLGNLMNINQGLLSAIGVSSEEIEKVVFALRKAGAIGAKLTGAGIGGCVIALFKDWSKAINAKERIQRDYLCLIAKPQNRGVYVE